MKKHPGHSWNLTPSEAKKIQLDLREKVITQNGFENPKIIAALSF